MARVIATFCLLLYPAFSAASTNSLSEALNLFNAGKYQESFDLVTQYLQQDSRSPTAYKLLGMDEYMLGHPREALASVTHATELAPGDADALYYLGRLYFTTGNMPAALETLQKTASVDPSSVRTYNQLGQTFEALGRRVDAEKAYLKAIELERDQPRKSEWPDYNLGVLYFDDGRTADAIAAFRRALQVSPTFPDAKVKLAVALSKEHPVPEAFELLQQALDTDPQNAEGHYRLALLLRKSGKVDEAKKQFELFEQYRKQ